MYLLYTPRYFQLIFWAHCMLQIFYSYYMLHARQSNFIYTFIDANHLITRIICIYKIGRGGERAVTLWQRLFYFFYYDHILYISYNRHLEMTLAAGVYPRYIVFTYLYIYKRHSFIWMRPAPRRIIPLISNSNNNNNMPARIKVITFIIMAVER